MFQSVDWACIQALSICGGPKFIRNGVLSIANGPIFVCNDTLSITGGSIFMCNVALSIAGRPIFLKRMVGCNHYSRVEQWTAACDHSMVLAAGSGHAIKGWHQSQS